MNHNPEIEIAYVDGEIVTFDGERLNLLNGAAAEVFVLLDGAETVLDVATTLAQRYQQPVEQMVLDVGVLIADFTARGLLAG